MFSTSGGPLDCSCGECRSQSSGGTAVSPDDSDGFDPLSTLDEDGRPVGVVSDHGQSGPSRAFGELENCSSAAAQKWWNKRPIPRESTHDTNTRTTYVPWRRYQYSRDTDREAS